MNYGKIVYDPQYTDDNGSFKQKQEIYRKGVRFTQMRYEERVRVRNETEELAEIVKFLKEHPEKSAEFRREKPKNSKSDYYHVVKCWNEDA